ncbi:MULTISPECIES: DUF1972 domain-containing protein [Stenotrophomonas]|uniref:DUF1972 domain-containing protein n=1 Tax=Stenotrophomonas lactitubi TaxID=2045214 RepID=A0AAW4GH40_9GAMM|nr:MULTISPECIES: DUF1972 domain-containing protein [Stenotrophomonas]MBM9913265.1 DUF1972 domain-containing protein [Stenotrophomonas lactitubi]MBM9923151.1 DUF1972 domain-containing protein [Stenotrophomonas lactitubi]MBM9939138.1 DUF1972 domain-containing protein [Stenotrophomonas lactitubi]
MKTVRILGIRGVPATHGGFETFAEHLSRYLVDRGWRVVVYCQKEGAGQSYDSSWEGVELVNIPVFGDGALATVKFDLHSTIHASKFKNDICLILGYNTASFAAILRARGVRTVMNMDGIEWSRAKWGIAAKSWLWLNERAGCHICDALVADHPEIARHLQTRVSAKKITTIAYGGKDVMHADRSLLDSFDVVPGRFATVIARPEPENSLLEIVQAYSRTRRGMPLVVLGKYDDGIAYHRSVIAAASPEVRFVGAVYDKSIVQALRYFCAFYMHGHQVGGTNPSLVEAMGAGNAIIAHDNRFNRWVAGSGALYFSSVEELSDRIAAVLDGASERDRLSRESKARFSDEFTWDFILAKYETLLAKTIRASAE